MASVNELLTEALEAFGAPGGPIPATSTPFGVKLKRQLIRTLRVRIPQFVPGLTRDGIVEKTIVPSSIPAEDVTGIYAWPAELASAEKPVQLVDVSGQTIIPRWFSHPDLFWAQYDLADLATGTPSGVLVRGKTFRFRPIPETALGPILVTIHGTLCPAAPANDTDDLIALDLEDAVVAGTVVFTAMREGHDDVRDRFIPQWEAALKQLRGTDLTSYRAVYTAPDF